MDEIKFYCPECRQKIGVQSSDAGRQMDCPICQSAIIVPASATLPVQVVAARKSTHAVDPDRNPKDFQETIRLTPQAEPEKPAPPALPDANEGVALAASKAEVARLQSDLESASARLKEVLAERDLLASRFADAAAQTSQLEAELVSFAEKNAVLEKEGALLKAQLGAASASERENRELRAQFSGRENQLAAMTSVCENQRVELRNLEAEVIKARAELDAARLQTQNVRRQLREVGDHFGDSERERVQLQRQLQQIAQPAQVTAVANELAEARARLSGQAAELESLKAERGQLLEQLRQHESVDSRPLEVV